MTQILTLVREIPQQKFIKATSMTPEESLNLSLSRAGVVVKQKEKEVVLMVWVNVGEWVEHDDLGCPNAGTPGEFVCSRERLEEIVDEVLGASLDIQIVASGKGFDSSDGKGAVVREGPCQFKKILVGESILARVKKFVKRLCKLGK